MPLKIGFIGAGEMANAVHYPSVKEYPNAELVAVCDIDSKTRTDTADRFGIRARYPDYKRMLTNEELDVVYVVTSPFQVKELISDCLRAGKHVFTEKPLGCSAEDAREMADLAIKHNCLTAVGYNRRFAAVFAEAKKRVEAVGPVNTMLAEFHKNMKENYEGNRISIMRSDIVHIVDALCSVGGQPIGAHSYVDELYGEGWLNNFNAIMRFRGGMVGVLTANRKAGNRYERFEMHAKGITAYIRPPDYVEIWEDGKKESTLIRGEELCGTKDFRITYGYKAETFHFLECVERKVDSEISFAKIVATQELAQRLEAGSKGA